MLLLGTVPQAVSQVENGARLTPRNLYAFAAALGVPVSSFFEPEDPADIDLPGGKLTIGLPEDQDEDRFVLIWDEQMRLARELAEKVQASASDAADTSAEVVAALRLLERVMGGHGLKTIMDREGK